MGQKSEVDCPQINKEMIKRVLVQCKQATCHTFIFQVRYQSYLEALMSKLTDTILPPKVNVFKLVNFVYQSDHLSLIKFPTDSIERKTNFKDKIFFYS